MNDFLKKLRNLGVNIDLASNLDSAQDPAAKIEDFIAGDWIESNGLRIFLVKKAYPYGQKHGRVVLENDQGFNHLSGFWQMDGLLNYRLKDFLFLDTETSSLSIGAGSLVFLFGCCHFVKAGLEILQVFIEDPSHEPLFLSFIEDHMRKFKCLVTYNGKSFDIPVMRSRYVLNRIPHHLPDFDHIDLLHIARRIWKYDLDSQRLADIEGNILEFSRGEDEIPGWLVPQIYVDYLQNGNPEALKGVFYHNEMDVVSLAALFQNINHMLLNDDVKGNENLSIGEIYQKSRHLQTADRYYRQALKGKLEDEYRARILENLARSLKKQDKWEDAVKLWQELAGFDNEKACVELAKFYEHKAKDLTAALEWTQRAFQLIDSSEKWNNPNIADELSRRENRLKKKIGKSESI